jgi:hypothetical protein
MASVARSAARAGIAPEPMPVVTGFKVSHSKQGYAARMLTSATLNRSTCRASEDRESRGKAPAVEVTPPGSAPPAKMEDGDFYGSSGIDKYAILPVATAQGSALQPPASVAHKDTPRALSTSVCETCPWPTTVAVVCVVTAISVPGRMFGLLHPPVGRCVGSPRPLCCFRPPLRAAEKASGAHGLSPVVARGTRSRIWFHLFYWVVVWRLVGL